MSKTLFIFLAIISICLGCRREDIREVTVEIPSLTAVNQASVKEAFVIRDARDPRRNHVYDGIYLDSFAFDLERKTVTLRYDSMKIAHTNIRMLIEKAGLPVVYPPNRNGQK